MSFQFKFVFYIFLITFGSVAYAQDPPPSPDCWRCETVFCADLSSTYDCPNKPCEPYWEIDPNDPNTMNKRWRCAGQGVGATATYEIAEGQTEFEVCHQTVGQAGKLGIGRYESEVVCSIRYDCGCKIIGGAMKCINTFKNEQKGRIETGDRFDTWWPTKICVYVQATPGGAGTGTGTPPR